MPAIWLDDIAPIHLRVDRGLQHVDELEEQIGRFMGGRARPYRIDHKPDGDGWFLGVIRVTRQPSPYLGVIAGEAVLHFSHALDNLMTLMLRLNGIQFDRAPSWPYVTGDKWANVEPKWRRLLRPEHFEIVSSHQPFTAAPDTTLEDWALRDVVVDVRYLANHDKHQGVHVAVQVPQEIGYARDPSITGLQLLYRFEGPLVTGTRMYRVRFTDPRVHTTAIVIKPDVAFPVRDGVWIGAGAFRRYGEAVLALIEEVRQATPEFHWSV